MSLTPRWYREELLKQKLLPNTQWALDLTDQQDYNNRKKAIDVTLDNQEYEYQKQQNQAVTGLINELKRKN